MMKKKYGHTRNQQGSRSVMETSKPIISRNFDVHAYKEKLAKIPSYYSQYNSSKNEVFSSSMTNCKPPYNVFVSHRIFKEVQSTTGSKVDGGINSSYYYRKYRGPKQDSNDIAGSLLGDDNEHNYGKSVIAGDVVDELINEVMY